MKIWKWTLQIAGRQVVTLPAGAEILEVQVQYGQPQLWALCPDTEDREQRTMALYGTGHPLPNFPGSYIGTFQLEEIEKGALVFHVFEVEEGQ